MVAGRDRLELSGQIRSVAPIRNDEEFAASMARVTKIIEEGAPSLFRLAAQEPPKGVANNLAGMNQPGQENQSSKLNAAVEKLPEGLLGAWGVVRRMDNLAAATRQPDAAESAGSMEGAADLETEAAAANPPWVNEAGPGSGAASQAMRPEKPGSGARHVRADKPGSGAAAQEAKAEKPGSGARPVRVEEEAASNGNALGLKKELPGSEGKNALIQGNAFGLKKRMEDAQEAGRGHAARHADRAMNEKAARLEREKAVHLEKEKPAAAADAAADAGAAAAEVQAAAADEGAATVNAPEESARSSQAASQSTAAAGASSNAAEGGAGWPSEGIDGLLDSLREAMRQYGVKPQNVDITVEGGENGELPTALVVHINGGFPVKVGNSETFYSELDGMRFDLALSGGTFSVKDTLATDSMYIGAGTGSGDNTWNGQVEAFKESLQYLNDGAVWRPAA
jgi:hypothetical protein